MSLRISGGRHRGRPLQAMEGLQVRPTGARAREAAFDILAHGAPAAFRRLRDAEVLDAFAGTGALGLEALSRGAARATFIEKDRAAVDLLRANAERLGEGARSHVIPGDATRPPPAARPVDIAFLDPPYGEGLAPLALVALAEAGWLATGSVAMVETAAADGFTAPAGFRLIDQRRYGKAAITFLVRE
ncbi:DNA methyltransferase [Allostella vacuolata]|nr:DNA methyltransferase [Stella vacuolata]